jgi:hypothetical protein
VNLEEAGKRGGEKNKREFHGILSRDRNLKE